MLTSLHNPHRVENTPLPGIRRILRSSRARLSPPARGGHKSVEKYWRRREKSDEGTQLALSLACQPKRVTD